MTPTCLFCQSIAYNPTYQSTKFVPLLKTKPNSTFIPFHPLTHNKPLQATQEINHMKIFYFTGSGNSLAVAKAIAGQNGELIAIPQVIDDIQSVYSDDCIGIVFPIYYFSPPPMVRQFLQKTQLQAKYTFAIATCGYSAGPVLYGLQKKAKKKGYTIHYAQSICMMDNYLPGFDMQKEKDSIHTKNIDQKLQNIVEDIQSQKLVNAKANILLRPLPPILRKIWVIPKTPSKYFVDDHCTSCGICAKVCPAGNIQMDKKPVFDNRCESCFACLHHCPHQALHHKKEKSTARYINPQVRLIEIIRSNQRKQPTPTTNNPSIADNPTTITNNV